MTKTIGILTSGGDCAGLNSVLKAITHRAIKGFGWNVLGIKYGTMGFLKTPMEYVKLDIDMFDHAVFRQGGTILGTTNKGNPFHFPMDDGNYVDRSDEIVQGCTKLGLDALIGIGGDGSLKILHKLFSKSNVPFYRNSENYR